MWSLLDLGSPRRCQIDLFWTPQSSTPWSRGAGILSNDQGNLKRHRDTGLFRSLQNPLNLDKLTGTGAIGHVRYATAGKLL